MVGQVLGQGCQGGIDLVGAGGGGFLLEDLGGQGDAATAQGGGVVVQGLEDAEAPDVVQGAPLR